MTRRSVRSYEEKPVDRAMIEQVVEAGIAAPSGMNRQGRRFTVIQDRGKIQAFARAVGKAAGCGPEYSFYKPAVFIVVSDQKDDPNGLANCACALENMMLAARGLELGSVWINQVGEVCWDAEVREQLSGMGLEPDQQVYGALALGWPASAPKAVDKRQDVVHWN